MIGGEETAPETETMIAEEEIGLVTEQRMGTARRTVTATDYERATLIDEEMTETERGIVIEIENGIVTTREIATGNIDEIGIANERTGNVTTTIRSHQGKTTTKSARRRRIDAGVIGSAPRSL